MRKITFVGLVVLGVGVVAAYTITKKRGERKSWIWADDDLGVNGLDDLDDDFIDPFPDGDIDPPWMNADDDTGVSSLDGLDLSCMEADDAWEKTVELDEFEDEDEFDESQPEGLSEKTVGVVSDFLKSDSVASSSQEETLEKLNEETVGVMADFLKSDATDEGE